MSGDRDPGYGASSRMVGEVAVCLAKDLEKSELSGGFWTPAAEIANKIVPRLVANAEITFHASDEMGNGLPIPSAPPSDKAQTTLGK